jgi:hypothetical protein
MGNTQSHNSFFENGVNEFQFSKVFEMGKQLICIYQFVEELMLQHNVNWFHETPRHSKSMRSE